MSVYDDTLGALLGSCEAGRHVCSFSKQTQMELIFGPDKSLTFIYIELPAVVLPYVDVINDPQYRAAPVQLCFTRLISWHLASPKVGLRYGVV